MRKNVRSDEIAHLWVNGSQPSAQSSSASFEGDKFFSYGTVIGQKVRNKAGRRAYLINSSGYSSTTSMWQAVMKSAIPKSARRFYVPGVDRWMSGTFFDHKRILAGFDAMISWRKREAQTAREPKKTRLSKEARAIERKRASYVRFFSL